MMRRSVLALVLALGPMSAHAEAPFTIGLPLLCSLGKDCWPARSVDAVKGGDYGDYTCRRVGENQHSGVDFAIRDRDVMMHDVPVVAVADGVVLRSRDEATDAGVHTAEDLAKLRAEHNSCGNAVIIRHRDGWTSQYCHMRSKSVRVHPGQHVSQGETIGFVGNSGEASYPHVHLTMRHGNDVIDPFTGLVMESGCGQPGTPMWQAGTGLDQPIVPLFSAGMADLMPSVLSVTDGTASRRSLKTTAPQLLFWAAGYYVVPGDVWQLTLTAPDGRVVVEQTQTVTDAKAVAVRAIGRRRPGDFWPPGHYTGIAKLTQTIAGKPVTAEIKAGIDLY